MTLKLPILNLQKLEESTSSLLPCERGLFDNPLIFVKIESNCEEGYLRKSFSAECSK